MAGLERIWKKLDSSPASRGPSCTLGLRLAGSSLHRGALNLQPARKMPQPRRAQDYSARRAPAPETQAPEGGTSPYRGGPSYRSDLELPSLSPLRALPAPHRTAPYGTAHSASTETGLGRITSRLAPAAAAAAACAAPSTPGGTYRPLSGGARRRGRAVRALTAPRRAARPRHAGGQRVWRCPGRQEAATERGEGEAATAAPLRAGPVAAALQSRAWHPRSREAAHWPKPRSPRQWGRVTGSVTRSYRQRETRRDKVVRSSGTRRQATPELGRRGVREQARG